MRFFTDQDVYGATVRFLRVSGHDVVTAYEEGLSRAEDRNLLAEARRQNRIFVTRDRDFGSLVFVENLGKGVVYLRILPSAAKEVHKELGRVLSTYSEEELNGAFVVVEPGRHRFRILGARGKDSETI